MHYTTYRNIPGLIIFLDLEKAFDSLEWKYLFNVLHRMNFGPGFVTSVKSQYTNINSCIINNGVTSKYFSVLGHIIDLELLSMF